MIDQNEPMEFKFGITSRIIIGVAGSLCALIFILRASDGSNEWYLDSLTALLFFLVVGACFLPKKIRGYCGDVIAVFVILLAGWFLVKSLPNPGPGENPLKFAYVYGGLSVAYLISRYKHRFSNKSPAQGGKEHSRKGSESAKDRRTT